MLEAKRRKDCSGRTAVEEVVEAGCSLAHLLGRQGVCFGFVTEFECQEEGYDKAQTERVSALNRQAERQEVLWQQRWTGIVGEGCSRIGRGCVSAGQFG